MHQNNAVDVQLNPNAWLREMSRLSPAKWDISRSSRAALAIALPMLIGYLTGTLSHTMWIAMGTMFPSMGERDAPYSFTIRKVLISAPIGACGFLVGYVGLWGLDWGWIVLLMSVLAFCLAIASSYSATLSIACLQFMVMAAVSLGNPEIGQFWMSSVLMLVGATLYLLLLLMEKWLRPHHLRKDAIVQVLQALIDICQNKLDGQDLEAARLQFNIKYEALYNFMLQTRYRALGHNKLLDQTADVVQNLDNLFAALLAEDKLDQVQILQTHLRKLTDAFEHDQEFQNLDSHGVALWDAVNDLTFALWGSAALHAQLKQAPKPKLSISLMLQKLSPGKTTLRSATALALCTAIGYALRWVDDVSHWYWVPMTVAIVMKPELGSIFVRAVQRTVGTAMGVLLGGFLLAFVPVGPLFILIIATISFFLPWLSQRNYALTTLAVTPLVLVLIDFLSPVHHGLMYADLRLLDTLTGCAIVLIFGYMLWPRRHASELNQAMSNARLAIANYLQLVLDNRQQPEAAPLSDARRDAYGKLVDMRSALQKSMAEPPPAGYEAAAWFPLVACAARLCDAITVYSATASAQPAPQEWTWLQQMPKALVELNELPVMPDTVLSADTPESRLLTTLNKENHVRLRLYERVEAQAHHLAKKGSDGSLTYDQAL